MIFLSTPSARRATAAATAPAAAPTRFLSTPSARRATDSLCAAVMGQLISIHALREEGDFLVFFQLCLNFGRFLSTPSARRATGGRAGKTGVHDHFYPRPPRGGRRRFITCSTSAKLFLSTPSARRATRRALIPPSSTSYFYPRPPRGGRRSHKVPSPPPNVFLSTPSARRATCLRTDDTRPQMDFYPRPPRGGRLHHRPLQCHSGYFYPRPPRGGRPAGGGVCTPTAADFYPRPPRGGRLPEPILPSKGTAISIHALREEGDLLVGVLLPLAGEFLSTPSARRATH